MLHLAKQEIFQAKILNRSAERGERGANPEKRGKRVSPGFHLPSFCLCSCFPGTIGCHGRGRKSSIYHVLRMCLYIITKYCMSLGKGSGNNHAIISSRHSIIDGWHRGIGTQHLPHTSLVK